MSKEEKIKTDIFNAFSVDEEYLQVADANAQILDERIFIYNGDPYGICKINIYSWKFYFSWSIRRNI